MTALTPEQREEYHRLAVECLTIYNPDDPEAKVARYALDQTAKLEAALAALWKIHGREWAAGDTKAGARHASEMWAIADLALQKPQPASDKEMVEAVTLDEKLIARLRDGQSPSALDYKRLLFLASQGIRRSPVAAEDTGRRGIESAPKDELPVLVWVPEWHCYQAAFQRNGAWMIPVKTNGVIYIPTPSHWWPLPLPPAPGSKG